MKKTQLQKSKRLIQQSEHQIMLAALIWVLETSYFLIKDGWHWTAQTQEEVWCDRLVTVLIWIAVIYWGRGVSIFINQQK